MTKTTKIAFNRLSDSILDNCLPFIKRISFLLLVKPFIDCILLIM